MINHDFSPDPCIILDAFPHYLNLSIINMGNMVLVGALCPGFCLNIFYRLVLPTSKKALRPGPVYRRWVGLNKVLPRSLWQVRMSRSPRVRYSPATYSTLALAHPACHGCPCVLSSYGKAARCWRLPGGAVQQCAQVFQTLQLDVGKASLY